MKKLLLLVLVLVMATALAGCSPDAAQTGVYQKISPEDVKKLMDNGDDIIIVDVRTAEEYNSAYIGGAINIPVETITETKPAKLPDLDADIIVYCRTGVRSETAAKKLLALGYTSVRDMGGIQSWPYETVTAPDASASADAPAGVLSDFKSTTLNGDLVDETIFDGKKLTMINIWATFCTPCLNEMPDLAKLNTEYADKGFQIVGIIVDIVDSSGAVIKGMEELAGEIIDKTGADYPHLLPSADLYGLLNTVTAVPTTIFVDENGSQVGETYVGSMSGEEWTALIDSLLSEVK